MSDSIHNNRINILIKLLYEPGNWRTGKMWCEKQEWSSKECKRNGNSSLCFDHRPRACSDHSFFWHWNRNIPLRYLKIILPPCHHQVYKNWYFNKYSNFTLLTTIERQVTWAKPNEISPHEHSQMQKPKAGRVEQNMGWTKSLLYLYLPFSSVSQLKWIWKVHIHCCDSRHTHCEFLQKLIDPFFISAEK